MSSDKALRHNERMKRQKEIVDSSVEQATIERGVLIVLTGNGKGKTTSALGTLMRSLGHGQRCALVQFIKGQWDCGETRFLSDSEQLTTFTMDTGFTWDTQNFEQDMQAAQTIWQQAKPLLNDPSYQLIVFDELTYMLKYKYLDSEEVLTCISNRPAMQNVIVTGRGAPQTLIDLADTVSEIRPIKHAFNQKIKAQQGIEW